MTTEDAFGRVLKNSMRSPWVKIYGQMRFDPLAIFHKYDRPPSMQLISGRLHNMGTSHLRGLRNGLKTIKLRRWS